MEAKNVICQEIDNLAGGLEQIDPTSKEYVEQLAVIDKLAETKTKLSDDKKFEKVKFWITTGLTAAGIIVPTILTVWGTKVSIEFEKEGTFTTIMGRGFINKLLGKK